MRGRGPNAGFLEAVPESGCMPAVHVRRAMEVPVSTGRKGHSSTKLLGSFGRQGHKRVAYLRPNRAPVVPITNPPNSPSCSLPLFFCTLPLLLPLTAALAMAVSIVAALPLHLGSSSPCCSCSPSYEHGLQASGLVKSGPVCRVGVVGDACKGVKSWRVGAVRGMAPDEEKMTRRSPLDFPIEWDRPRPGRRADIFPQFSPMKTPLPPPLPADPPEEDEEEEEKKEEEEENPDEPEKPDVSF